MYGYGPWVNELLCLTKPLSFDESLNPFEKQINYNKNRHEI